MDGSWNYNISEAPKGHAEKYTVKTKNGEAVRDRFVPKRIIVATKCGAVTMSTWIPPRKKVAGRWEMLATNEEPIAWQPWPDHPNEATP